MNFRSQPLTNIGGYKVSEHAKRRMRYRLIRDSELVYTLDGQESIYYQTYAHRTIIYNNLTGISVVQDNQTGIIITVTETDERRQRMRLRKRLAYESGTMMIRPHHPPSLLRCCG